MTVAVKRGFTIVELLVVITIIGILMAMLFPAVNSARVGARRAQCISRQGQLGQGILNYALPKDRFPGWTLRIRGVNSSGNEVTFVGNWVAEILPNIDRQDLQDAMIRSESLQAYRLDNLLCPANLPANRELAALGYVVNSGQQGGDQPADKWMGVFFDHSDQDNRQSWVRISTRDLKDGAAYTIMVSECVLAQDETQNEWNSVNLQENRVAVMWAPGDASGTLASATQAAQEGHLVPSSKHPGDVVVTFCDGRTIALNNAIEKLTFHRLMTSDGQQYAAEAADPLESHMLEP